MARECYEDRNTYGQRTCGYHAELLTERRVPSQTQDRPMILLVCPVSGKQLVVLAGGPGLGGFFNPR